MSVRVIQGDVRDVLPTLAADSFDCIVTSPPYFGLRDYGTATWEGGDPECDHKSKRTGSLEQKKEAAERGEKCGYAKGSNFANYGERWTDNSVYRDTCGKCGAQRIDAQIGLERTLDEYLETMVAVCRELRRVLKPSGVFFLNIGDSYAGGGTVGEPRCGGEHGWAGNGGKIEARNRNGLGYVIGLKPKDLCLVPERLGIALQADGWWVRSRIVWAKPNPMPESCTDRPTSAHETIWMLTKSARYFWDGQAVKEDAVKAGKILHSHGTGAKDRQDVSETNDRRTRIGLANWNKPCPNSRNLRNVWSVAPKPFPGAHFATMPPVIIERCIKAGSSERGCCPACGAPWVRVVDVSRRDTRPNHRSKFNDRGGIDTRMSSPNNVAFGLARGTEASVMTLGWEPSCECPAAELLDPSSQAPDHLDQRFQIIPARILDPFAGAGTTGLVGDRLGRDCTLIDLNTEYIDMAADRIRDDAPLFTEVSAE